MALIARVPIAEVAAVTAPAPEALTGTHALLPTGAPAPSHPAGHPAPQRRTQLTVAASNPAALSRVTSTSPRRSCNFATRKVVADWR